MRLTSAPSGPPFVGAPGDALVCLGGAQWGPGAAGGGAPYTVLGLAAPWPLGGSQIVPMIAVEVGGGGAGVVVATGLELFALASPVFYEVIWSAANNAGPNTLDLQLLQDPLGAQGLLTERQIPGTANSVSAVVRVGSEQSAAERTIRFDAIGSLGVDLVRCWALVRRITP